MTAGNGFRRLRGRLGWPGSNAGEGGQQPSARPDKGAQRLPLDWRAVQDRLGPVRHRWDLAILSNLSDRDGRKPSQLLAAINDQAAAGRQLRSQVLSGRLRVLEGSGYIRHEDQSRIPLVRVYFLLPPATTLIEELLPLAGTSRERQAPAGHGGEPCARPAD